jgi:hypothetical protein
MSHLQRRYLDYFYVEQGKGTKKKLVKVPYMKPQKFMEMHPMAILSGPNAVFPCEHERRDFLSKKGKKHNRTRVRMKRNRKARVKARNQK